jgi:predicted Zn-dependent protease with MMP-like domain
VRFAEFERAAREAFEEIPEEYLDGIDGLTVRRAAPRHPSIPEVYTLGECLTEEHPSDYGSPDTTRSVIALYWGSFRAVAARDPDFDWNGEIWETLTHELRHHLESLAGDDALEGVDYAADQTFKRADGEPFDPWYWQHGSEVTPGVYEVEGDVYVEQLWSASEYESAEGLKLKWLGRTYRLEKPPELGDVHFVFAEEVGGPVELVLVRRRSWWEDVRRLLGASRPVVHESVVRAEPVEEVG